MFDSISKYNRTNYPTYPTNPFLNVSMKQSKIK